MQNLRDNFKFEKRGCSKLLIMDYVSTWEQCHLIGVMKSAFLEWIGRSNEPSNLNTL